MTKDELELWLRDPRTKWFLEELNTKFQFDLDYLKTATEPHTVYRLQGTVKVLDYIRTLLNNPTRP